MIDDAKRNKLKQIGLFLGCVTALTVVFYGFITWTVGSQDKATPKKAVISNIPSITKDTDDSGIWMQKMEAKLVSSDKKNGELEKQLQEQRIQMEQLVEGQQQLLFELSNKLNEISENAIKSQEANNATVQTTQYQNGKNDNTWPPVESGGFGGQPDSIPGSYIHSTALTLSDKNKNLKNKENYIPSGSFVRAIVLGGVDASASITSQTEPRPMLLRLVDLGMLPNNARKDIQDCHIVAAAHGDVSSERAYIRTERISCTLTSGKVFESPLEGYIAGEDGKDGVRGKLVRREGDLLLNSFFAGTIAGLGKGMSQSLGTTSISPLGSTTTISGSDVLKSGAYGGVGEGADRLEKYFIERAEQYQPVIQVAAGREVTVVFTKGLSMDMSKG